MTAPRFDSRAEWERARTACHAVLHHHGHEYLWRETFDRLFPPPAEDAGRGSDLSMATTTERLPLAEFAHRMAIPWSAAFRMVLTREVTAERIRGRWYVMVPAGEAQAADRGEK